jgi:hypothetical protein
VGSGGVAARAKAFASLGMTPAMAVVPKAPAKPLKNNLLSIKFFPS